MGRLCCALLCGHLLCATTAFAWTTVPDWLVEYVDDAFLPEIQLDPAGNPHIAALGGYWIRSGGTWLTQESPVDGLRPSFDTEHVSIDLDDSGSLDDRGDPGMVYRHTIGAYQWYARWVAEAGRWVREIIDRNSGQLRADLAYGTGPNPHVAYSSGSDLMYATKSGDVWTREKVDDGALPPWGYAHLFSIDVGISGEPQVANQKRSPAIHHAIRTGGSWVVSTVDESAPSSYVWIALDAGERPHLAYRDGDAVSYATRSPTGWITERVSDAPLPVPSIAVDADGVPTSRSVTTTVVCIMRPGLFVRFVSALPSRARHQSRVWRSIQTR